MSLLPSILANGPRTSQPLLVLQSSAAQSSLPLLKQLITQNTTSGAKPTNTLLFTLLYPPKALLPEATLQSDRLTVHDLTHAVPGYDEVDLRQTILSAVKAAESGSMNIIIDSVDTLYADLGSVPQTRLFMCDLLVLTRARSSPSRLILHITTPSPLLPLLTQLSISPSLTLVTAHPTALLTHISTEYLTPPPPASPSAKFWGVFIPVAERSYESDRVVFGSNGEGSGGRSEIVVEILVRGGSEGSTRRKGVERVLEGWSESRGPCELVFLTSLKSVWSSRTVENATPDPTQNVSFNLNLTPSQQESRAQVPLPYAHEGKPIEKQTNGPSVIHYDPDSADDIDDDDPDEDLDI